MQTARTEDTPPASASSAELVRYAIEEARTLVQLEVELAKRETRSEIQQLRNGIIAFGLAAVTAILGLAMMLVTPVLATGARWEVALTFAGVLLIAAGIGVLIGTKVLPRKPLDRTRHRVEGELTQLKERVA
jgi:uncharacterized membrane protein YqjE